MSAYEKSQTNNNLGKKHAARCDKDNHRSVCPSKLSKRELEDLYYSLLENNLELKKTINAQNEKNRILSTKVQRMTAQTKNYMDNKDCCAAGKAIINDQKAAIADLTKANEAMADRVRRLSTQLCTAKQFLKQNPNGRHCYKCYVNATTSVKNLSTTSLQNKTSDANLKSLVNSAVYLDRETPVTRAAENNTSEKDVENDDKGDVEKVCNENRCRSTMEDFKQKIEELEEELAKTHEEYSSRMTQLENQVSQLQAGAVRARSELGLRARDDALQLARSLRDASADKAELEALLSIEKKKVAELEMRLKAAEVSQQVARAIEGHLNAANRLEQKQLHQTSIQRYSVSSNLAGEQDSPRPIPTATTTPKRPNELTVPDDKLSKSDDSGYADHRRESYSDEKSIDKTNQELIKKIGELQAQLDALKLSSAKREKAETELSSYRKTLISNDKDGDDDQKSNQPKKIPKRPQISILEPETVESKRPNSSSQSNSNSTNEQCNRSKLERNYGMDDMDVKSLQNVQHELDNTVKNQTDTTNESTQRDHEGSGCFTCVKKGNKEGSDSYLAKSKDIAIDKDVDDVSESKSQRVSEVIFQSGSDYRESQEIKPKSPDGYHTEESKIRHPSTALTSRPSIKSDDQYQQIPGPLPTHNDSASTKQSVLSNRTLASNWKKTRIYGKKRTNDEVLNKNKIDEIEKAASVTKDKYSDKSLKNNLEVINNNSKNGNSTILKYGDDNDITNDANNKGLVIEAQSSEESKAENRDTLNESLMHSIPEKYSQRKSGTFSTTGGVRSKMKNGQKERRDRLVTKTYQPDKSIKSDIQGTNQDLNRIDEFGSVIKDVPLGTSTPKAENRAAIPISPHTYTVDAEGKRSRATSPDNTDNEISVMSDLPTEKEANSPREALSPGEHKTTATITESYSVPNEYTLSEGEVPAGKYSGRKMSKSVGEASSNDYPEKDNSLGEHRSSSEKMEAALQAISQELARCRWLLQSQRTREWESRDVATGLDCAYDSLILRRSKGLPRIDGTVAPSCLFIVHVATVVLADEAVIRSRNARFLLTWRFFDSDITVTPMCVGRVLNFHFSTQYYVEMTKDVVNYLRNEDMLIMICEVDRSEKPFATCALPLQQVLINANKRVDFSLPLRARSEHTHPYLREKSSSTVRANEDVGVIDVWCMLHCDRTNLPDANRTVEPPSSHNQALEITVLWLTLNENCDAMLSNDDRKLYVAYAFLGRDEAELETPISLPKPKHSKDKCIFNFRKCFNLTETDMQALEHMTSCRSQGRSCHNSKNCIVFAVVSEPPEDPMGLENCEDIGFAFLYFGDLLAYSLGDSLVEVLPVRAARAPGVVCGGLAVQVDGLYVLRALKERTK